MNCYLILCYFFVTLMLSRTCWFQGWFDFSSARYSMGTSRVNSVLLDLKEHSAATHLEVAKGDGECLKFEYLDLNFMLSGRNIGIES